MIGLFERNDTDFTGHGMCALDPTVCTVAEVAGGSYVLHLEHPMDEAGKYLLLTEERIIKAPVPPIHIPEITLPNVKIWETNKATALYIELPATRRIEYSDAIKKAKKNPNAYSYNNEIVYKRGAICTYQGYVWECNSDYSFRSPPGGAQGTWTRKASISGPDYEIVPDTGKKAADLASGIQLVKTADYNGTYMQARVIDPDAGSGQGKTGYILIADCNETETETSGQTIPGLDITEQLFRIYEVSGEDDTETISVEAKHISYDFQGNALYTCKVVDADPMTAISIMKGSLLEGDDRLIACNVSGTVNEDWSFYNPINALLDPDEGLVPVLGARLVRNNRDFYILDNSNPRPGIRITYGINMTGVKWSRNIENVITRVLPRCGDGNDGWLYLPEVYVESPISTEYAIQRTEMMDCGYDVGDTEERYDGDPDPITITEEYAKTKMREEAQNRFDVDKVDAVEVELDVSFILLGDTEEFSQYKGLQTVCLYDEITVEMGKSGMIATAQVSEYEWDSILGRYNSIKVGDIKSLARRIPGYRLKKGSISYAKLGNSVISKIKSATNISGGES